MEKIDLSIIIPAYNEEKTITDTIRQLYDFLKATDLKFEIIVVDDGSVDSTATKVKEFAMSRSMVKLVSYKKNMGKGEAIRQGVLVAGGELILFSDADLSTPISEIKKLLPFIRNGYDIVIGSRRMRESFIAKRQPFHRRISGNILRLLVKVVLRLPFSDTQCGFKLFKKNVAKSLFSKLVHKGFIFDIEILYKAYTAGYKIKEVGVIWANDPSTTVRFFKDSFKFLIGIIKIRFGR